MPTQEQIWNVDEAYPYVLSLLESVAWSHQWGEPDLDEARDQVAAIYGPLGGWWSEVVGFFEAPIGTSVDDQQALNFWSGIEAAAPFWPDGGVGIAQVATAALATLEVGGGTSDLTPAAQASAVYDAAAASVADAESAAIAAVNAIPTSKPGIALAIAAAAALVLVVVFK